MAGVTEWDEVVGTNVARVRRAKGLSQAALALNLGLRGLTWTRATVAQIETGRRSLSLAEGVALAQTLDVPLADFVVSDGPVRVQTGTWSPRYAVAVVSGGEVPSPAYISPAATALLRELADGLTSVRSSVERTLAWWGDQLKTTRDVDDVTSAVGPSERAAAARLAKLRLGVAALDVAMAAQRRWGRSLDEERDARVAERSDTTDRRSVQALRGLVSRQLDREIAEEIEAAADRAAGKEKP